MSSATILISGVRVKTNSIHLDDYGNSYGNFFTLIVHLEFLLQDAIL